MQLQRAAHADIQAAGRGACASPCACRSTCTRSLVRTTHTHLARAVATCARKASCGRA
jgi:hypothetical protein